MNRILLMLGTLLLTSMAYCQEKSEIPIPAFGKIDKSDFDLKECDFDKNAEAIVLFDVAEMQCNLYEYSVNSTVERHIRIKIFNDKSLEQANIRIPYLSYKSTQEIVNINAQTYNIDASGNIIVSKLEKKAVYDKEINKKVSAKIFSFPEVKAGSILEYSYAMKGSLEAGLGNWYFQSDLPVKLSRYTIKFPAKIEVLSAPIGRLPIDLKRDSNRVYDTRIFTMTDIPALRDEPYISCKDDYLQRVESTVIAINTENGRRILTYTWLGVIRNLMQDEDFGVQLTKNIRRTDDLEELLKNKKDPYTKMMTIYRYVRKNMEWNGHTNIWALNGVNTAWKEKKGTSGEINLILINLLKNAELDASPILVSGRENGKIDILKPSYRQFDKVMAYVKINEKIYVLDATDKYGSPKLIPLDVMDSEGLIIEKIDSYKYGWVTLWDNKQLIRDQIYVNAAVDDHGEIAGKVTVTSFDYSRSKRLPKLKTDRDKFIKEYFKSSNAHIDSFEVENEEIDTLPLVQHFKFNQPLNASGDYKYFSLNLFSGFDKNPFVSDTRFSDIFFGARQHYVITGIYTIPEGYSFEELPKNVRLMMPDTSIIFTRILETDGDRISSRITLEFGQPEFEVTAYDSFRGFYKRLFALLNEQIVIKKRS